MPVTDLLTLAALMAAVLLATPFLGRHMADVLEGQRTLLSPILGPLERGFYRIAGIDPAREQGWRGYAVSMLTFSLASIALLYLQQRLQASLPLNPTGVGPVAPDLALNTAVSFTTNTNWQNYAGESTMAHLTQALGLAVQNFASASVGIAVAIALVRGIVRRSSTTIGNFWVDLTQIGRAHV